MPTAIRCENESGCPTSCVMGRRTELASRLPWVTRRAMMAGMRTLHWAMVMVMRMRFTGGESHSHWILPQKPCSSSRCVVSTVPAALHPPCSALRCWGPHRGHLCGAGLPPAARLPHHALRLGLGAGPEHGPEQPVQGLGGSAASVSALVRRMCVLAVLWARRATGAVVHLQDERGRRGQRDAHCVDRLHHGQHQGPEQPWHPARAKM